MKFLVIVYLLPILGCSGNLVFPGSKNRGRCEIEEGVYGKCEDAEKCIKNGGIASTNGAESCRGNGRNDICCRKPFRIAREVCKMWQSYWRQNDGQCVYEQPLIVGGEEAGVGQFPHIAILGYQDKRSIQWICGGTLISPHFVLTAAHCVLQFHQFIVRFGEHDIFRPDRSNITRLLGQVLPGIYRDEDIIYETRNKIPTEQTVRVADVIIYPEYDKFYNDIALLRLERPVVLNKRVLPACLPIDPEEDFNNVKVTAAGWGRIRYNKPSLSRNLLKVKIPTISRNTCWERIASLNNKLIPKGIISSQLCAGQPGKDTCKGDSGGPLVIQLSTDDTPCEHTVAGVVSFGPGCGLLGVYTRVSSYVDWITKYIAPEVIPVS